MGTRDVVGGGACNRGFFEGGPRDSWPAEDWARIDGCCKRGPGFFCEGGMLLGGGICEDAPCPNGACVESLCAITTGGAVDGARIFEVLEGGTGKPGVGDAGT